MEIVTIIWIIIFFLFALTLLFVWSKLYLLNKRIEAVGVIIKDLNSIDQQFSKINKQ